MHRKKVDKLPFIILTGIIILIVAIVSVAISTIISKKTFKVSAMQKQNQIDNNVLIVEIENNIEENIETNETENEIVEENTIDNETNQSEEKPKQNQGGKTYKLEVNCTQNVVNVYKKDENGEYTNCVKAMLCSVGPATPTSGTYSLKKYGGWEWKGLFGDVYGQYATQITGNILFHSVPYTTKYDNSSLEYWEYDKLGTPASMGCVRLTVKNAKWIYDNCVAGTLVKFYQDSNPGPLGKPSEQKISSEEAYRSWDPTDPNPDNPWRNYSKDNNNSDNSSKENNEKENIQEDNSGKDNNEKDNTEIDNTENENTENNNSENDNTEEGSKDNSQSGSNSEDNKGKQNTEDASTNTDTINNETKPNEGAK